jgi:hypothetical protein
MIAPPSDFSVPHDDVKARAFGRGPVLHVDGHLTPLEARALAHWLTLAAEYAEQWALERGTP